jgi:class 3 adenylate cyclase
MAAAVASSSPHRSAPNIRVTPEQPDTSATLDGERKTVTALFADIKGSTELTEDLDPEDARGIIDPALKLMIDAVHRYDGYVVQSTGDGIFALFGAPIAHEDHPQRALYAAIRMQEDLKRYSAKVVAKFGSESSWSMRAAAPKCGPSNIIARSRTSLRCKTRSWAKW